MYSQDPESRFCAQCGERRTAKDAGGERCADCAATPVPNRFCRRTGRRLDPPPPAPRSLLSSYLGSCAESTRPMPGIGAMHTPINEGLVAKRSVTVARGG